MEEAALVALAQGKASSDAGARGAAGCVTPTAQANTTQNLLAEQMRTTTHVPAGLGGQGAAAHLAPPGGEQSHKRTQTTLDGDFNKKMLFVFDETELEQRRVQQMHGNMQLIVELYKHDQISSVILNTCIEDLLQEVNNQNIEILCKMLWKLADNWNIQF